MRQNQSAARRLAASLSALGMAARVQGGGVHWRVDVAPVDGRSLHINCFWYDRLPAALMLGMNPRTRVVSRAPRPRARPMKALNSR